MEKINALQSYGIGCLLLLASFALKAQTNSLAKVEELITKQCSLKVKVMAHERTLYSYLANTMSLNSEVETYPSFL